MSRVCCLGLGPVQGLQEPRSKHGVRQCFIPPPQIRSKSGTLHLETHVNDRDGVLGDCWSGL